MSLEAVLKPENNVKELYIPDFIKNPEVFFNSYIDINTEQSIDLLNASQDLIQNSRNIYRRASYLFDLRILRPDIFEKLFFDRNEILEITKNEITRSEEYCREYNYNSLTNLTRALRVFSRNELSSDLIESVFKSNFNNLKASYLTDSDVFYYGYYAKLIYPQIYKSLNFQDRLNKISPETRKDIALKKGITYISFMRVIEPESFRLDLNKENAKNWKTISIPTDYHSQLDSNIADYTLKAIISAPVLEFRDGYVMPIFNPKSQFDSKLNPLPDRRKF